MKVGKLRQLLKAEEQKWFNKAKTLVVGNTKEILALKSFVAKLSNKNDTDDLDPLEIFDLVKIIPSNNLSSLFSKIKQLLSNNYFFEVYNILSSSYVIDKTNFTQIYQLSCDGRLLLNELFNEKNVNHILLTKEILELVLQLYSVLEEPTTIRNILVCLHQNKLLNSNIMLWMKNNVEFICLIEDLLSSLKDHGILDAKGLEIIGKISNGNLNTLLDLFKQNNVKVDHEFLAKLCTIKDYSVITMIDSITKINNACFNQTNLVTLLSRDSLVLFNYQKILLILEKNHLVNFNTVTLLFSTDFYASKLLGSILEMLSKNSILDDVVFNKMLMQKYNKDLFEQALKYLDKSELLPSFFNHFNELVILKPAHEVFGLLNKLLEKEIWISKEDMETLLSLSENRLHRVKLLVAELDRTSLLSKDSFQMSLQRVTLKSPMIEQSIMTKISRKKSGLARSEVVINECLHYFTNHTTSKAGGYGLVKSAFKSSTDNNSLYAVKKLHSTVHRISESDAKREVKINQLLNREANFFKHKDHYYILTDWYQGKVVSEYSEAQLRNTAIMDRIKWISSGLVDVNNLHRQGFMHGDIKPANFILDSKKNVMTLIDFGTCRKHGSKKSFGISRAYSEASLFNNNSSYDFGNDMYSMGLVISELFPELFSPDFKTKDNGHQSINPLLNTSQKAVIELVNAMCKKDIGLRCTAQDALNFCEKILNHYTILSDDLLDQITKETINRSVTQVEDILRGAYRY